MEGVKRFISSYKKGAVIYSEDELQSHLYIINKGKVQLKNTSSNLILITLVKGDFFGEESLNDAQMAAYTAEVVEDSDLIKIPYEALRDMMEKSKDISLKILRKLSEKSIKSSNNLVKLLNQREEISSKVKSASKPKDNTSVALPPDIKAYLIIQRSNRIVQLTKTETYIGRKDYTTGYIPDIDLTKEDDEKYISRKHSKIAYINDKFYLSEEPGAVNGTFLKGNKLKTGVKYGLSNEDELTLCHLNIIFKY